MNAFNAYKNRIDRASFEGLSDISRQIENDRKLTGKDKLVLTSAIARRAEAIAKMSRIG